MTRSRTFLVLNVLPVLCMLAFCFACQAKERRSSKLLIPEGYVGWVKINYKVISAPALRIEDGSYILRIPRNGHFQTSTDIEYGVAMDEYYYYSGDNLKRLKQSTWDGGGMIWGEANGKSFNSNNEITEIYKYFFVGTEADYKEFGGDYRDNKVGPIEKRSTTKGR